MKITKLFASAAAAVMTFSVGSVNIVEMSVSAEEITGTYGDNITHVLTDDGELIISGKGEMSDSDWLDPLYKGEDRKDQITKVTIQDGITSIGAYAFDQFVALRSITIPDSVTSIGDSAFFGCSRLTEINIPDTVTRIDAFAFAYCTKLKDVVVPASVEYIGMSAFSECMMLQSLTIENPDCEIYDENEMVATWYNDDSYYYEGVIYGHEHSTAQKYAQKYGCRFGIIGSDETYFIGDANNDGKINVRDCACIAGMLSKSRGAELSTAADFNCDGVINVRDSAALAKYLANTAVL